MNVVLDCAMILFLGTDCTDGHGLGLYDLNNGIIVQTMLPFHKCCRIDEIKGSVICVVRVNDLVSLVRRNHCSSLGPAQGNDQAEKKNNAQAPPDQNQQEEIVMGYPYMEFFKQNQQSRSCDDAKPLYDALHDH